jgi:hypothetical protein
MDDKELLAMARKHEDVLIKIDNGEYIPIASNPDDYLDEMGAGSEDPESPTAELIKHLFLVIRAASPYGGGQKRMLEDMQQMRYPRVDPAHEHLIYGYSQMRHKDGRPYSDTWIAAQMNGRGLTRQNGEKYYASTVSLLRQKLASKTP